MPERKLPTLRLLTVFETVFRTGTIQKAASELNVTQPAVSQALKALEDEIGVRLLDRSTRPASLTEAGRLLQAGVSDGLGRIEEAILKIRALRQGFDRSVTISCSVGTATYWLMPRLAAFYNEHPDIAVNVMTTAGAPEFSPGVDILIRYGTGDWRDGQVIRLLEEKVVPVCSPEYRQQIDPAAGLSDVTLLHVVSNDKTWLTWQDFFDLNGLAENSNLGRYFTNYVQATQAALSGQGVMLGWETNTGDLVREGRLVALGGVPLSPREAFYLVTRDSARPACQTVVDWIRAITADTGDGHPSS